MRVHLKVRFAPFFTVTRSASSPPRRSTPRSSRRRRSTSFAALEDDRPIRLLGVRAEMVPPEVGTSHRAPTAAAACPEIRSGWSGGDAQDATGAALGVRHGVP